MSAASGAAGGSTANPMRVRVDTDRCIGAGQCVLSTAAVFDQNHEGVVQLVTDTPPPEEQDAVREAVDICPAQAISIE